MLSCKFTQFYSGYAQAEHTKQDSARDGDGLKWLTVPCGSDLDRRICDVRIENSHWQRKHWEAIRHGYSRAAHFERYRGFFEELYLARTWRSLSELNQTFIKAICREVLGIDTEFRQSSDYSPPPETGREERWIAILREIGAQRFVIGPSARQYLSAAKEDEIRDSGIELVWMDYSGYPEHRQLFPPFEHKVSIIDLILNEGPNAPACMMSFR